MQNLLKRMFGKIISFNKKIKKLEDEIEKNKIRINEITKLRHGKNRTSISRRTSRCLKLA